jgi:serralysin
MANIFGTNGADTRAGDGAADLVSGGTQQNPGADTGSDTLDGGGGNDTVLGWGARDDMGGNGGNDSLDGGDGGDYVTGGTGSDTLKGGLGDDELRAEGELAGLAEDLGTRNRLEGGAGNDTLVGEAGIDLLLGEDGNDSLLGGADVDDLRGGAGADSLAGEAGNDKLLGGTGAGRFLFGGPGEGRDVVKDFTEGEDLLVLSAAGFGGGLVAGGPLDPDAFEANNTGKATDADTRVVWEADSGRVWWDADGSGDAGRVLVAILKGTPDLSAFDILIGA